MIASRWESSQLMSKRSIVRGGDIDLDGTQQVSQLPTGSGIIVGRMLRAFADGTLFGEQFGNGAPWLLALHGWGRSHADFVPMLAGSIDAVRQSSETPIDAIALDLPGFGATPPPPEAWGTANFAKVLIPLLDEMNTQVVVIGHSFGGLVATQLAGTQVPGSDRRTGAHGRAVALLERGTPFRVSLGYRVVRFGSKSRSVLGAAPRRMLDKSTGLPIIEQLPGVMRDILVRRPS